MSYEFPILRKGWVIQCLNDECGIDCAEVTEDLYKYRVVKADHLKSLNAVSEYLPGRLFHCFECGEKLSLHQIRIKGKGVIYV